MRVNKSQNLGIAQGNLIVSLCLKITQKVAFTSFWKPEACGQTVLPERSVLIGNKLVETVENAKNKNSNATLWVIFKQCDLTEVHFFLIRDNRFPRFLSILTTSITKWLLYLYPPLPISMHWSLLEQVSCCLLEMSTPTSVCQWNCGISHVMTTNIIIVTTHLEASRL